MAICNELSITPITDRVSNQSDNHFSEGRFVKNFGDIAQCLPFDVQPLSEPVAIPRLSRSKRLGRRTRVYGGRLLRTALNRKLKAPCVYMHVPKCGGTSLSEALYALVPMHQKIGIIDSPSLRRALAIQNEDVDDRATYHDEGDRACAIARARELLLLMYLAHDCQLVHGHFLFSERSHVHFGERVRFVSILREPIARTVSNFHQARRGGAFAGDFDAFLNSAMARRMALHVLRYFSGAADPSENEIPMLMERAKANMARFAVLGFIEDLPGFLDRFEAEFGARPKVPHVNRTEKDETVSLSIAQRRRLETMCAPDIALTEHARTLF